MKNGKNTEIVKDLYKNFQMGDIPAILNGFTETATWSFPAVENIPYSGVKTGKAEIGEFFRNLGETSEVISFEPKEFTEGGNKVYAEGYYDFKVKETGRSFKSDWIHVWTIKDGKISAFQEYTDTNAISSAYPQNN